MPEISSAFSTAVIQFDHQFDNPTGLLDAALMAREFPSGREKVVLSIGPKDVMIPEIVMSMCSRAQVQSRYQTRTDRGGFRVKTAGRAPFWPVHLQISNAAPARRPDHTLTRKSISYSV